MRDKKIEIFVNSNPFETRVAITEDGSLAELYVERPEGRKVTGNVYKGRVARVLPGMQSAFINIGLSRTAFLHVSDIQETLDDVDEQAEDKLPDNGDEKAGGNDENTSGRGGKGGRGRGRGGGKGRYNALRIQDILKDGQEIVVQVTKEPMGSKGARVSSYISLAGRYLVFMPSYDRVAVSRRIAGERERRRLKKIVQEMRPDGYGFIIRTVCEGASAEDLKSDMDYLVRLWKSIDEKKDTLPTPSILHEELALSLRMARDKFSSSVKRLVLDREDEYEKVRKFTREVMPALEKRLERYGGEEGIFERYGIEIEIDGALENKIWLRSGGFLIIDQMEALTAIDVNTGKYVGKKDSEHTIVKTNLEAVDVVVRNLRLRNIGGIIVIDFIDMAKAPDRDKVYNALREALKADQARTNILRISELGIVEMTRKRLRNNLIQSLCKTCPTCEGVGFIKSEHTVLMDIYRALERDLLGKRKPTLYCNPVIAERLRDTPDILRDLEERFERQVTVVSVERFQQDRFEVL
ncbi:MAG: ribonuclease E/G [Thermodesulfobacteriota bacterium]